MTRAVFHENDCPLRVPAEKQMFEVNSHLPWGLITRISVLHEGHFLKHIKAKPVREERKRKDFLNKNWPPSVPCRSLGVPLPPSHELRLSLSGYSFPTRDWLDWGHQTRRDSTHPLQLQKPLSER